MIGRTRPPGTEGRDLDVLGVGDASVDCFVQVDRLPEPGEKVAGTHLGVHPGGVVANLVAGVARLGLRSALVARVGDDVFGQLALEDLRARAVDVSPVVTLVGTATYLCLVHLDAQGEKALTIARTDAMFPAAGEVDDELLRRTRHVHVAPFDLEVALDVARRAHDVGATVSVDLEPTSMGRGGDQLAALVAETDVLLPNSYAVEAWLGVPASVASARQLLERGPRMVAIGCGPRGAIVADAREQLHVPARATTVRDTTGAGDAFNAVVVSGWLLGWPLARIGERAAMAAAQVIGAVGGRTAQPTRQELEHAAAPEVPS
jgi:sugar/nucleoside kinase (ribokinase family)